MKYNVTIAKLVLLKQHIVTTQSNSTSKYIIRTVYGALHIPSQYICSNNKYRCTKALTALIASPLIPSMADQHLK